MSWTAVYKMIQPYIVRIRTPSGYGTGFLFAYGANRTVCAFATAAHVVDHAQEWDEPIRITHHGSGSTVLLNAKERAILVDSSRDTASIVTANVGMNLPDELLMLVPANEMKLVGVEVGWVGFPCVAPSRLCFFSGRVSAAIDPGDSYLLDGVAINGVSGGPVFAEYPADTPQLMGTVSAYISNRATGESLPGLLKVQDLTAVHEVIQRLNSLGEAQKKEAEQQAGSSGRAGQAPAQPQAPREPKPNPGGPAG